MKKLSSYYHVDNGGPTLSVVIPENRKELDAEPPRLEIEEGYYGYSSNKWTFYHPNPKMLKDWALKLLEAATIIESQTSKQFD